MRIVDFTRKRAEIAASLRSATKHLGLSLGDRACLTLAISLGLEVYTADRAWMNVDLYEVHLVR